jgi:hypothetical protein
MDSRPSNDQLNSNRIRQMAALRRSAYRSRSYCVIALGGCVVGAAELIFDAIRRLRGNPHLPGILVIIGYFAAAGALLFLSRFFIRLAVRFHRESKISTLPPAPGPPDFSQLQDGSQVARNLEDM